MKRRVHPRAPRAKSLAQQRSDFTSEGAPVAGTVAGAPPELPGPQHVRTEHTPAPDAETPARTAPHKDD